MIARHRPLLEPDPASMRRIVENWCMEKGKPIERAAIDYGGGAAAPLIADDADVTVIASHAARMAIDILIPRDPSIFPDSVYLVGLAKGWIFDSPFETYPIAVGSPAPPQPEEEVDPPEASQELARIFQILSKQKNADPPDGRNP